MTDLLPLTTNMTTKANRSITRFTVAHPLQVALVRESLMYKGVVVTPMPFLCED